ncbi:MAG: hypothetical protein Q8L98_06880 [Chlamydiales bacterium]|nr:hypothetical protein [Chlamydiales bacterium]
MATQACSETLYQKSIQQALHFYSQAEPVLGENLKKMDCCKGEWSRQTIDLSISTYTAEQKEQIERTALTNYHTFQKTKQLVNELFQTITKTRQLCTRNPISEDAYETMKNLGIMIEIIREHENALCNAVQHLETIEKRIKEVFKDRIEQRIPEIEPSLDGLMSVLHPELVGWGIVKSLYRGQPALTKTYDDWVKNASEEQKNGSLLTKVKPLKEFSFAAVDPTFSRLDEALKTLDLSYLDPQTNKGYGLQPASEEGWKEAVKEPEEKKLEQVVEETPITLEQQPSFLDLNAC